MKHNESENTASAVITAGPAGSEALTGTPLILEKLLRNFNHRACEGDTFADAGRDEANGHRLVRMLRQACALVDDGHVHVGLIYPESRTFIEPLVSIADEVSVVYEYGTAWIHTLGPGSQPIIQSRDDSTNWDFHEEHPSKVRLFSLYVLQNGRLKKISTKPARGYYDKDEHH